MAFKDGIFTVSMQARDVECGVDKEAFGEFQSIVVRTNPVGDDEGAEPFDVQLFGWACGGDVASIQPDLIANIIRGSRLVTFVIVPCHVFLG